MLFSPFKHLDPRSLAWPHLAGGTLLLSLILALSFSGLVWWRFQGLHPGIGAACQELALDEAASCLSQALFTWLWQPTWVARAFSLLTSLAALGTWLLLRRVPSARLHGLLLGLASGGLLLVGIEPGRLAALCALIGASLGGALASWCQQRARNQG